MGSFNKEVELTIPPKKQNTNNKTVKIKSSNGYASIKEKLDEGNTLNLKQPVINEKPKTKVGIGSQIVI